MTDWPALRREYVNGSLQLKELAEKHGLKAVTVRVRAHREDWESERNAVQRAVTQVAQTRLTEDRATALARFNDDDLKVARAIRGKAASMLATAKSPADLRALASAMGEAQKIGRLALGATTDNTGLSDPNGGPIPLTNVPVGEYLKARAQVLQDY